jgi:hypothetical protein
MDTAEVSLWTRRFSLGDGVILIAAAALTLALLRAEDWFGRFPERVHSSMNFTCRFLFAVLFPSLAPLRESPIVGSRR